MSIQTLLKNYVVDSPHPLLEAKTIQIVMVRELLDYTVLRTEETRELNVVATPTSIANVESAQRVAFLATKQKAAESRQLEQMLRTATREAGLDANECYLKDKLCLACPRCGLFGGTNVESGSEKIGNIRHRIEYGTAFSLQLFKDIGTSITFNGVIDATQSTGQALGARYAVIPASVFPSIVTLRSVTWREVVLTLKTLLACKSYGAESRIGGDARNTILGIAAGWEEVITPLELTLEMYDRCVASENPSEINLETAKTILDTYKEFAGNKGKVKIFSADEVESMIQDAADLSLDKAFLDATYADVAAYREVQKQAGKKK